MASSAPDPFGDDIGGGWFDAPGIDSSVAKDPLAGAANQAPVAMSAPAPTGSGVSTRERNEYWDDIDKGRPSKLGSFATEASLLQRFLAFLIDQVFAGVAGVIFTIFIGLPLLGTDPVTGEVPEMELVGFFATWAVVIWFVFGLLDGLLRTPGKLIMGTRVVSADGTSPTLGQGLSRNIWRLMINLVIAARQLEMITSSPGISLTLSIFAIGFWVTIALSIGKDREGKGWHDHFAGTAVQHSRSW